MNAVQEIKVKASECGVWRTHEASNGYTYITDLHWNWTNGAIVSDKVRNSSAVSSYFRLRIREEIDIITGATSITVTMRGSHNGGMRHRRTETIAEAQNVALSWLDRRFSAKVSA